MINCNESQYVGYKKKRTEKIYWLVKFDEFKVKKKYM